MWRMVKLVTNKCPHLPSPPSPDEIWPEQWSRHEIEWINENTNIDINVGLLMPLNVLQIRYHVS